MTYNSSIIKSTKGIEVIRKRPGMFIGETNRHGLHHLISEIVDNCVDEALAGYCNKIDITFHPEDNSVEISDNGRGISVDIPPDEGISAATIIYTILSVEPLHGIGAVITNSLSSYLELNIRKNGKVYYQRFEKAIPIEPLKVIRDMSPDEENGTTVRFSPDLTMFPEAIEEGGINLSASYIKNRIKSLAYLVKKLSFNIIDEFGEKTEYYFENGIKDLVDEQTKVILSKIQTSSDIDSSSINSTFFEQNLYFSAKDNDCSVEVCFNYLNKYSQHNIFSFANKIHTKSGGTHVMGFEIALKEVLNDYAIEHKKLAHVFKLSDVIEGINLVISFSTKEPKFCDAVKKKLSSSSAQRLTYSVSKDFLTTFLEKNPLLADLWIERVMSIKRISENFENNQNCTC